MSLLWLLSVLAGCGDQVSIAKIPVDSDNDGYDADVDCDDGRADINPEAEEHCDGKDNNCDGVVDDDATDPATWYADADGDGVGGITGAVGCVAPSGYVSITGDCDDQNVLIFPGNPEVCDGLDNDCNKTVDDNPADPGVWYPDADGDGYGNPDVVQSACTAPAGYIAASGDCDDHNADVHPAAVENDCTDPLDYNCDGLVNYADADGDGAAACVDCDDTDALRSPYHSEICDAARTDEDCDGLADDDDPTVDTSLQTSWYVDQDGDGYGTGNGLLRCHLPPGMVAIAGDCDDAHVSVSPASDEICDAADVDENCNGASDDADPSVDPPPTPPGMQMPTATPLGIPLLPFPPVMRPVPISWMPPIAMTMPARCILARPKCVTE